MISCGCDDWYDIRSVGTARIVTARKHRECMDCRGPIRDGDVMYVQSMFDFDEGTPVCPYYMCEACGDLAESLMEQGYCFTYGDVREQWLEYLEMRKDDNA